MNNTTQEQMLLRQDLCFVDFETTGFNAENDRIIEVGILRISGGEVVEEYSTLVYPEIKKLPKHIKVVTGITDNDLKFAPTFKQISAKVHSLLSNSIFVAHNADFDYGFIESEFRRLGISFGLPSMCTVKFSRTLYPDFLSHNLDSISQRFNIDIENRHRALDDAIATWEFFRQSKARLGERAVEQAMLSLIKEPKVKKVTAVHKGQMSLLG